MPIPDEVREQRTRAREVLMSWIKTPVTLPRPVCFVPGWRDERAECWSHMEMWLKWVCSNYEQQVHVIQFFAADGRSYPPWEDFLDFASDLADYVNANLAGQPVDLVCHSMGGLDALAAIALMGAHPELGSQPVRNVQNVITYDTPFCGFAAAGNQLLKKFVAAGRQDGWVQLQLGAMEPDSKRIAEVKGARDAFLQNVAAFWPRGAENLDGLLEVPHESASFGERADFAPPLRPRYHDYVWFEGTSHSGAENGVTHDFRAIVDTVQVLTGKAR